MSPGKSAASGGLGGSRAKKSGSKGVQSNLDGEAARGWARDEDAGWDAQQSELLLAAARAAVRDVSREVTGWGARRGEGHGSDPVSVEELTRVMHDLGETALENRLEQLVKDAESTRRDALRALEGGRRSESSSRSPFHGSAPAGGGAAHAGAGGSGRGGGAGSPQEGGAVRRAECNGGTGQARSARRGSEDPSVQDMIHRLQEHMAIPLSPRGMDDGLSSDHGANVVLPAAPARSSPLSLSAGGSFSSRSGRGPGSLRRHEEREEREEREEEEASADRDSMESISPASQSASNSRPASKPGSPPRSSRGGSRRGSFGRAVSFPKGEHFPERDSHGDLQFRPPTPLPHLDVHWKLPAPNPPSGEEEERSVSFPPDESYPEAHAGASYACPSPRSCGSSRSRGSVARSTERERERGGGDRGEGPRGDASPGQGLPRSFSPHWPMTKQVSFPNASGALVPEALEGEPPYRPPTPGGSPRSLVGSTRRSDDGRSEDARSVSFPDDETFPEATRFGSPLPERSVGAVARQVSVKIDGPLPELHLGDEPFRPPSPWSLRGDDDARSVSFQDYESFPEATRAGSPLPGGMDHRLRRRVSFPNNQPCPEAEAGDDLFRPPTPVPDECRPASFLTHEQASPEEGVSNGDDAGRMLPRQNSAVSFSSTQMMPEAFVGEKSYRPSTPLPMHVGSEFERAVSFPKGEHFKELSLGDQNWRPPTPVPHADARHEGRGGHAHGGDDGGDGSGEEGAHASSGAHGLHGLHGAPRAGGGARTSSVSFPHEEALSPAVAQYLLRPGHTGHPWEAGSSLAPPSPDPKHPPPPRLGEGAWRGQDGGVLGGGGGTPPRPFSASSGTSSGTSGGRDVLAPPRARPGAQGARTLQSATREKEWRAMRSEA